jgi:hypothetical protein
MESGQRLHLTVPRNAFPIDFRITSGAMTAKHHLGEILSNVVPGQHRD